MEPRVKMRVKYDGGPQVFTAGRRRHKLKEK